MSPGSDTLLVDSPLRLKRLFNVGGFNSTASIISGIIGAELERFMTPVDRRWGSTMSDGLLGDGPTRTRGEWRWFVADENSCVCDWRDVSLVTVRFVVSAVSMISGIWMVIKKGVNMC